MSNGAHLVANRPMYDHSNRPDRDVWELFCDEERPFEPVVKQELGTTVWQIFLIALLQQFQPPRCNDCLMKKERCPHLCAGYLGQIWRFVVLNKATRNRIITWLNSIGPVHLRLVYLPIDVSIVPPTVYLGEDHTYLMTKIYDGGGVPAQGCLCMTMRFKRFAYNDPFNRELWVRNYQNVHEKRARLSDADSRVLLTLEEQRHKWKKQTMWKGASMSVNYSNLYYQSVKDAIHRRPKIVHIEDIRDPNSNGSGTVGTKRVRFEELQNTDRENEDDLIAIAVAMSLEESTPPMVVELTPEEKAVAEEKRLREELERFREERLAEIRATKR